jgi:molybdenum cofactor cytidylyltransferase
MGRPKPLLPWEGGTLVGYQVRSLAEAGAAEVIVVLGHRAVDVVSHVRGAEALRILINPDYQKGKTTSIKTGLRAVGPHAQGILLLAVDQPRPVELLRQLIREHREAGALITQPVYQGRGGHPLLFHRSLLPELLEISEEKQGVRDALVRHRAEVHRVSVESPVALLDFNTWEEYQAADVGEPPSPAPEPGCPF